MVTRGRFAQARLAVECFLRQTYPRRELVIVHDGPDPALRDHLAGLHHPAIRLVELPDENTPLGALRNLAVREAAGSHVCQWDDDDLYDPLRLERQFDALIRSYASACLLHSWMIWWPRDERLAISCQRLWEGSLLCEKAFLPPYPELRKGEDTPVVESLWQTRRVVLLDMPHLYLYIVHGANTFGTGHFERHWLEGRQRFTGEAFHEAMRALDGRLPWREYGGIGY
ncbi:MAG: glycosyltransferase family 2 protein [Magnetococcales bacterium]|nr:glycosyltransferase family 2 protein [Magnetococcales bacterium]